MTGLLEQIARVCSGVRSLTIFRIVDAGVTQRDQPEKIVKGGALAKGEAIGHPLAVGRLRARRAKETSGSAMAEGRLDVRSA
jgi:hypothetical protein